MAHTTFADLPPELISNVFAFIRSKPDQGNVCLVSRVCRDLMAPQMWETLKTDLRKVSPRLLATLLSPSKSGILSHVQELSIGESTSTSHGEENLRLIITAMPQDRLRCFMSDHEVSTLTFQVLLRSQRKIDCMYAPTTFTTPGLLEPTTLYSEEHRAWMGSSLSELKELLLDIKLHESPTERIFQDLRSISRHCPKIEVLTLSMPSHGTSKEPTMFGILGLHKDVPLFSNLEALRLFDLKIAIKEDITASSIFDLSKLESIELSRCDYLVPFLKDLTAFYTSNTGKLERLRIHLSTEFKEPKRTIKAIEDLLDVCPKLRTLELDVSIHGLIAKSSILAHCQTLQTLMIGSGDAVEDFHFSVADMTSLLGACANLKQLAINMPVARAETSLSMDIGGDFLETLTAISTHPGLRTLRILNRPKITFDNYEENDIPGKEHVAHCQISMQDYANKIFQYMASRGSKLKVLIIKPSLEVVGEPLTEDINGHCWPAYNYVRGRLSNITGTSVVIAHPLKDVKLDFPGLSSLLDYV